jgi:regulator of protease activity HflC (stomatin/prohibitin superfamily)
LWESSPHESLIAYEVAAMIYAYAGIALILFLMSFKICNEWDRHVVFTLGRFTKVTRPGLYLLVPFLQSVKRVVDTRIITYTVPLQKGLTKDNIPVEVDAIVFYKVNDVKASVLNVDDYHRATQLSVRSAIRDMVGKSQLDELLSERDKIGDIVREHTSELVTQWGLLIVTVEIKDVIVSKELEDAIAREPAAEREKRARLLLAQAEELAADAIVRASHKYANDPVALQLRSMNMLYEMCMEGKSTMVFVPTTNTGNGMPSIIGMESVKGMIEQHQPRELKIETQPEPLEFPN